MTQGVHARRADAGPLAVPAGPGPAEFADLADELTEALSWWRGEPYTELDHRPAAEANGPGWPTCG